MDALHFGPAVWEFVFMMVVLKLPVVYLCVVVYWAVRAEPRPLDGAALVPAPEPRGPWRDVPRPRSPRRGPHGSPDRGYSRVARARLAAARARR